MHAIETTVALPPRAGRSRGADHSRRPRLRRPHRDRRRRHPQGQARRGPSPAQDPRRLQPRFANQALEIDPSSALLLPCNIVLEPSDDGGTHISAVDPRDLMPEPALDELADEPAARLTAALEAVHTWAETS